MNCRDQNSFWALWRDGQEWPSLYASQGAAQAQALRLAKDGVGNTVYLLRLEVVGTVVYPSEPQATGMLVQAEA